MRILLYTTLVLLLAQLVEASRTRKKGKYGESVIPISEEPHYTDHEPLHTKCRFSTKELAKKPYLGTTHVFRMPVPDEMVPWTVEFKVNGKVVPYKPKDWTDKSVYQEKVIDKDTKEVTFKDTPPVWADSPNPHDYMSFYNNADNRDRTSIRKYLVDKNTYRPRNPWGRTGLRGRGLLGQWGPNHTGDSIVTRPKPGHPDVLQFLAVRREDADTELACPGGMVDKGEEFSMDGAAAIREFIEEVVEQKGENREKVKVFLKKKGVRITKSYVDDHRNTDNSWLETIVWTFHDDENFFDKITFEAQEGEIKKKGILWTDITPELQMYASHKKFVQLVAEHHERLKAGNGKKHEHGEIGEGQGAEPNAEAKVAQVGEGEE